MEISTISESSINLKNTYSEIRALSEAYCKPLSKEDYIPQPVPFISPPKWHLAHTSWFYEAFILTNYLDGYQLFHKDFSYLFNSYYNAAGDRILRANRGNITRPGVDEVMEYRKYVDKHMLKLIEKDIENEVLELIILGLNHEQQHQELLITDLKYIFGHNPIFPVYKEGFSISSGNNNHRDQIKIEEGVYEIGYSGNGFFYDNEKGIHKQYIHECLIDNYLVSNGEFLEFIEDGGYQKAHLWLDEGWSRVNSHKLSAPLYWHKIEGKWRRYSLSGLVSINPEEVMCHVNFYEAAAYAEWKGKRLLTEFEWEVASRQMEWGLRWEWTNSAYLPYPGFETAPGAIGEYNGKFMINQMVLRGSSQATSKNHSRNTYRNFFHPHLGWQSTGIRLAEK